MSERITLETLNTAIEKLAEATKHGFDQVGLRFDGVDERFDRIDSRMDRMELRQDQMAYRFEVNELTSRVERIEGELSLN